MNTHCEWGELDVNNSDSQPSTVVSSPSSVSVPVSHIQMTPHQSIPADALTVRCVALPAPPSSIAHGNPSCSISMALVTPSPCPSGSSSSHSMDTRPGTLLQQMMPNASIHMVPILNSMPPQELQLQFQHHIIDHAA